MPEEFDVRSRLAEGEPAVENLQHYVWACHQIGYQHPDLTLHAVQIRDWYGSEDGMDLTALHHDWLALEDAARASQDALAVQDRQLSVLSAAWQGAGAEASADFIRRHGEASAAVAAAVRTATEAVRALRESLWRAVDAKVEAVVAIEGRAQAHRAEWLAAAATLRTGVGDRAVAAELVDQAVKPFVDSSIRSDWLTAMRTAMSSATDAYERAAAELAAEHQPVFDIPGDLGPTRSPPRARIREEIGFDERLPVTAPAGPATPGTTLPSAWSAPSAAASPLTAPSPATGFLASPPEVPAGQVDPSAPPLSGLGSGLPDVGSGLSGFGQQFADTLSGLLSGGGGGVPQVPDLDVPDLEVPELDDPLDLDEALDLDDAADDDDADAGADDAESDEDEADDAEADGAESDEDEAEDAVAEEPVEIPVSAGELEPEAFDGPVEVPADSAPAPTPAPPPAEPLPPPDLPAAGPLAAEQTPCAIAADELPQVGDPSE